LVGRQVAMREAHSRLVTVHASLVLGDGRLDRPEARSTISRPKVFTLGDPWRAIGTERLAWLFDKFEERLDDIEAGRRPFKSRPSSLVTAAQGTADQAADNGSSGVVVAASIVAVSIASIVSVTSVTPAVAWPKAVSAGKPASGITTAAVTGHGMSTHRVSAHGVRSRCSSAAAVTPWMTGCKSIRSDWHATNGDCGSESDQISMKHSTLLLQLQ
jgi:hypothetical protein